MSPRSMPPAIVASTVALAVAAGPLAAAAYGDDGEREQRGQRLLRLGHRPAAQGPGQGRPEGPQGDPKDAQGPHQGPGDELDGSYDGAVVTTQLDTSNKPTAQPLTAYEMPFPCGEVWTGTTRSSHSPSVRSIDFNRTDDFSDPVVAAAAGVVTTAVTRQEPAVATASSWSSTTATARARSTRTWTR